MDTTRYKYKTIKGDPHPNELAIHNLHFELHTPGQNISFGGKAYTVVGLPYRKEEDEFYTVELEQVNISA